ncbi:MAG: GNAT family N-acetyltransferase [Bacteroidota bacterium]
MKHNPFASEIYRDIWLKHYNNGHKGISFKFLKGVHCIKDGKRYVNVGKNFTNGMFYAIDDNVTDYKGKTIVVYDVPKYFKTTDLSGNSPLKCIKVRQYKGLYVDVSKYKTLDELLVEKFKKSKSRYNFRSSVKKLEKNYDISQQVFFGDIEKEAYDELIQQFKRILETRFDNISTHNTVLPMWDFYKEVLFPMILEKQVALNVMYDGEIPIAMSFSFVYDDDTFVVALRTFDMNYYKEGLGNIEIYRLIEWCMNNGITTLDFSKGQSDYKERWCDVEYTYEHHIIYDSKSLKASLSAKTIANTFRLKQYLRDKKVNIMITKAIYKVKKLVPGKA